MHDNLFSSDDAGQVPNLLPVDGVVEVYRDFFNAAESVQLFSTLINNISWQQSTIKIYGKEIMLPRLTAWYGDAGKHYSYSGIQMNVEPWTPELLLIKERIEKKSNVQFSSVLLNRYRDGNDSVSWHRDNEKVLGQNPVIGSVSFGATRTFKFRHINDHRLKCAIDLTAGMFLLMKNETQHFWEHSIPKSAKPHDERINLTFRVLPETL